MKISLTTLIMLFLLSAVNTLAFDAVTLEKTGLSNETKSIVGKCGETTVYLKNFNEIVEGEIGYKFITTKSGRNTRIEVKGDGYVITSDQTVLVLKSGNRIESLSIENGALSDYLGVNCMMNTKGKAFLLLRTNCSGSACGEEFHHVLFNTSNLKIINPLNGGRCNEKCFQKVMNKYSIK